MNEEQRWQCQQQCIEEEQCKCDEIDEEGKD